MQIETVIDLRVIRTILELATKNLDAGNTKEVSEDVRAIQYYLNINLRPLSWISYNYLAVAYMSFLN